MDAPYRRAPHDVLARFPLRTYPSYVMGAGVSLIAVLLVLMGLRAAEHLDQPAVWAALLAAAVIPFCVVRRMPDYRVAGGAGEIRLLRDRVEVPHPDSPEPIRMSLSEIRVQVPSHKVWVNGVSVQESDALILTTRTDERVLASELFLHAEDVLRAARAIRQLQRGLELEQQPEQTETDVGRERRDMAPPRDLAQAEGLVLERPVAVRR